MTTYRSWLPDDAIGRGVAALPLAATVRAWSSAWLAFGGAEAVGDPTPPGTAWQERGTGWALGDDGALLVVDEGAVAAVAAMMFGRPADERALTAADRAVIDAAAESCLVDLRRRLAEALGVTEPWRAAAIDRIDGWRFRIAAAGEPLAALTVAPSLVARQVRAKLPPVTRRARPAPIATALDPQPVSLSARVGATMVTTTELASLATGDVLVLDRALDQPADLAVDGRAKPLRCTIDRDDAHLRLIIA